MDMQDCAISCALVVLPKLYLFYSWAIASAQKSARLYEDTMNHRAAEQLKILANSENNDLEVDPFSSLEIRGIFFRNRVIKAATYEALCDNAGIPLDGLADFHAKMAQGGSSMCIVAYGSVSPGGRSFPTQLVCREEALAGMTRITDAIHAYGSVACLQLTHAGYFSDRSLSEDKSRHGQMSAQTIFNPAAFNFCRKMTSQDMAEVTASFVAAARCAVKAGFDCLEIHCGHGYLLSQFLSPKLNPGVSLADRLKFPCEVLRQVRQAVGGGTVVMVKMNAVDGVEGGLGGVESCVIAEAFAECAVDIIGISGGLILENGLFMLRGEVPLLRMVEASVDAIKGMALRVFGPIIIPKIEFSELYFRLPALCVQRVLRAWNAKQVKTKGRGRAGRVYVCIMGGVHSYDSLCQATVHDGFDFIQSGRATLFDSNIVNQWRDMHVGGRPTRKHRENVSGCTKCNMCIVDATMRQQPVTCIEWEKLY